MFEYAENFTIHLNNNINGKKETDEERSQRIRDTIYKPPPRGESIHDFQVRRLLGHLVSGSRKY